MFLSKPAQQDIGEWTESESASRIAIAIDKAFAPALRHADGVLRRLFAIERSRLNVVLAVFLESEKARTPFSIQHVEERLDFPACGHSIGTQG